MQTLNIYKGKNYSVTILGVWEQECMCVSGAVKRSKLSYFPIENQQIISNIENKKVCSRIIMLPRNRNVNTRIIS